MVFSFIFFTTTSRTYMIKRWRRTAIIFYNFEERLCVRAIVHAITMIGAFAFGRCETDGSTNTITKHLVRLTAPRYRLFPHSRTVVLKGQVVLVIKVEDPSHLLPRFIRYFNDNTQLRRGNYVVVVLAEVTKSKMSLFE